MQVIARQQVNTITALGSDCIESSTVHHPSPSHKQSSIVSTLCMKIYPSPKNPPHTKAEFSKRKTFRTCYAKTHNREANRENGTRRKNAEIPKPNISCTLTKKIQTFSRAQYKKQNTNKAISPVQLMLTDQMIVQALIPTQRRQNNHPNLHRKKRQRTIYRVDCNLI